MAVNSSGIFYMDDANTETLAALLEQLDRIIGYGKRADGKWYLADACQSSRINMWAYHKPIKASTSANLTSLERLQAGHGLVQNSSTFYIDYDMVTSGWWNRLRDFDGYNHDANPPIKSTSSFNKTLSFSGGASGQIVLSTDAFANGGSEIPINEIALFQTYANWYVGMMLYDKTSGKGYYQTTEWTLNQYVNGEATSGIPFLMEAQAPNIEDGVTYDFYYCLSMYRGVNYRAFSRGDIGQSLIVLCCDATHGHASVKAVKMGWNYIDMTEPEIYCSYRGYGSASIGVNNVRIKSTWNFSAYPNTNETMMLKAEIGKESVTPQSQELTIISSDTNFGFNAIVEISEADIEDYYERIVPIYIYGKFGIESSYKTLGYGRYDVVSKSWLSWYNYV